MEFEIGDEPQGLPDHASGKRDGGVREDRILFRFETTETREDAIDDASDEDSPIDQFGETG